MTSATLTRRFVIAAAAGAVGTAAQSLNSALAAPLQYDLSDMDQLAYVYAKIAGSTVRQRTYLQYYGQIYSVIPGQVQNRILRLKGLVRSDWSPTEDGSYRNINFDHGLFCDPETGDVLETYDNPFTGEVNDPLHYRSGPLGGDAREFVSGTRANDVKPEWQVVGDQISVTRSRFTDFRNPLQPDEWPMASTGERIQFNSTGTYFARVHDINNPGLSAVEADHVWTFITHFPAWMLMGQRDGFVMWRWTAKKIIDPEDIDPYIVSEIDKRTPGFLEEEEPWEGELTGWSQYVQERTPVR